MVVQKIFQKARRSVRIQEEYKSSVLTIRHVSLRPRSYQLVAVCLLFNVLIAMNSNSTAQSRHASNVLTQSTMADECVILLHGLARTSRSMAKLADVLKDAGYSVANIDYPSRDKTVQNLAPAAIEKGLKLCADQDGRIVHFVTHSMGGILVRQYLSDHVLESLGRVVMLAPPNRGSEVVDKLGGVPGFRLLNGPAGMHLGTDDASIAMALGSVDFDLGIVAGTRSINLFLSTLLPNPDDGKVSAARAQIEGMCDFIMIKTSHPFIMKNDQVIKQVLNYLKEGAFLVDDQQKKYALQSQEYERPSHCH